jgi:TonB-dependent SusC/RagA subfamily outer membrane receptor
MVSPVSLRLVLLGLLAGWACGGNPQPESNDAGPSDRTVTAEDIQRSPSKPIEQVLMEQFPSVVVERRGNALSIRIRGRATIQGDTEPLYVIDGMSTNPGPGGGITGLNPYDIESIRVLTNASETAMYGLRGANGVIVIKTKQHN